MGRLSWQLIVLGSETLGAYRCSEASQCGSSVPAVKDKCAKVCWVWLFSHPLASNTDVSS